LAGGKLDKPDKHYNGDLAACVMLIAFLAFVAISLIIAATE